MNNLVRLSMAFFVVCLFTTNSFAIFNINEKSVKVLTTNDLENVLGRKLTFKEKILFPIIKRKISKLSKKIEN